MSVLIPASKIDYSQATAMRSDLRDNLQNAVISTMAQGTIVRDLAAYDVSGAAPAAARYARLNNVNALVANTWMVADLARQLPQNQAIGIYGYVAFAAAPLIDSIAFTLSGAKLAQFVLAPIYGDLVAKVGYFDEPLIFLPGMLMGINLLAGAAVVAAAESYQLLGYIAEPGGFTVLGDAQRAA
jgi:hypothetical protein